MCPPRPRATSCGQVENGGDASSVAALTVTASNEYGRYSDVALALYGLEMVAEPHRPTTLTATSSFAAVGGSSGSGSGGFVRGVDTESGSLSVFSWKIVELDEEGGPAATIFEEGEGGTEVSVEFTKPGGVFLLTVEERLRAGAVSRDGTVMFNAGGTVIGRATVTVSCKHVRRELRDLSEADREGFLDAMEAYYAVSNGEGRSKYGEGFFDYELLAAYHSADVSARVSSVVLAFVAAVAVVSLVFSGIAKLCSVLVPSILAPVCRPSGVYI